MLRRCNKAVGQMNSRGLKKCLFRVKVRNPVHVKILCKLWCYSYIFIFVMVVMIEIGEHG